MILFIEKYFKAVLAAVGVLLVVLAAVSWSREHDARILAEQTVKESAVREKALKQEVADVDTQGKRKLAAQKKAAAAVQTPKEAIAAIPTVTELPLNAREIPDAPSAVQVEAVPLFQALNAGKLCSIELDTCQQKATLAEKIEAEKDIQIEALKKPKSFWKRFGTTVKDVGIGVMIGYGVHAATSR